MEISCEELFELIKQGYSNSNGDKSSASVKLLKLSHRIEFLDFLHSFLPMCKSSSMHIIFVYGCMRDIVIQRGCLMTFQQLDSHFHRLLQMASENPEDMVGNPGIINTFSDSVAALIRYLVELQPEKNQAVNEIGSIFQGGGALQVIAMSIVESLLRLMRTPLPHLSTFKNQELANNFKTNYLPAFANAAVSLFSSSNQLTVSAALAAFHQCLAFCEAGNIDQISSVVYPPDFVSFYSDPSFLESLFNLSSIPEFSTIASDSLIYFLSSSPRMWPNKEYHLSFLSSAASRAADLLASNASPHQLCRILHKISMQLDGSFLSDPNQSKFFEAAKNFSLSIFSSASFETCEYILDFWAELSSWKAKPEFYSVVFSAFEAFIESSLNSIQVKPQSWLETLENMKADENSRIWIISRCCFHSCCEYLARIFSEISFEGQYSESLPLQTAFLLKVVSARGTVSVNQGNFIGVNYLADDTSLFSSIIRVIGTSADQIPALSSISSRIAVLFESSVVDFFKYIQGSSFFSETANDIVCETIDLISTRLFSSLACLSSVSGSSDVILIMLLLVEELMRKPIAKERLANSELMQALVNRSITISFDSMSEEESKKPRTRLNHIYAELITNADVFSKFLSSFDTKFEQLNSPRLVFDLYRDLIGVASGSEVSGMFLRFIKWFISKHLDDSIAIIKNGSESVIKSVCRFWTSLFHSSDSFEKDKGLAIVLFRETVEIVQAVIDSCNGRVPYEVLLEIIYSCFTTKEVNYGVMKFYGDTSVDQMVALFFNLIDPNAIEEFCNNKKVMSRVLNSAKAISSINREAIVDDQAKLGSVLRLAAKVMLHPDENLWELAWEALKPLLLAAGVRKDSQTLIPLFRPHFVLVLDAIVNTNLNYVLSSGELLLYAAIGDGDYVAIVFDALTQMYDEIAREPVMSAFKTLFKNINPPVTQSLVEEFETRIGTFRENMKKYPTNFAGVPLFSQFFQG